MIEGLRFARDHRWTPRHLSAYLDGELAARARARLDRHVAECSECRGVLHSLRRMLDRLQWLPPPREHAAPEQTALAVRARLSG
jgi:anti-sigma factor RsiW